MTRSLYTSSSQAVSGPDPLELCAGWTQSSVSHASFRTGLDSASSTVRVVSGGSWSQDDVERYFEHQRRIVDEARARFGAVKVFFDVRHWVVEGPESVTQFQEANRQIYLPEDRLVAVVASSLHKQYTRTALVTGTPESFLSMNAAETWLQAYSTQCAA